MKVLAVVSAPESPERHDEAPALASEQPAGASSDTTGQARLVAAGLWLGATAVTCAIAYTRYRYVVAHADPVDLRIFWRAARLVAHGQSPFLVTSPSKGYVYTPWLAMALAPFSQVSLPALMRAWTVASLASVALAAGCIALAGPAARGWRRPVLFALSANAAYFLAPVTRDLELGQADLFILALISAGAALRYRRHEGTGAGLVGLGGALKVWPVLALVGALGSGTSRRLRSVAPGIFVFVAGSATALAFGGLDGVVRMLSRVVGAGTQPTISYSVWGIPRLWYSATTTAQPLDNSPELRLIATVLLAGLVAWLLWVALAKIGAASELSTWNVLGCVILLLPASHEYYMVYLLPLLWIWGGRALRGGREDSITLVVFAVLVLWWAVLLKLWPTDGTATPWTSSLPISVPFLANVAACSASVLGDWLLVRRAGDSGTPELVGAGAGGLGA